MRESTNAQDAGMPVAVRQERSRGLAPTLVRDFGFRLENDFALKALPFAILSVQFPGQRTASAVSMVGSRRKAFSAVARRPAALRRGPRRKPICSAEIGGRPRQRPSVHSCLTIAGARFHARRDAQGFDSLASRGTMSATVPSATRSSRRRRSKSGRGRVLSRAWQSLKTIPTLQR